MESKEGSKKRFYLKWPWNVVVYIVLAVVLRIFSIPFILLIMWWNKKQQPDGPEEGYCLQRTRRRLAGLIPAAAFGAGGVLALLFFYLGQISPEEVERMEDRMRIFYYLCPFLGAGALLIGIILAYLSLRDALQPEKSALARSIRRQLPYPDEAPPVEKLFAMVDQDLRENGQWCGKMGIGKEWVLGDEVSCVPRIRGVFGRVKRNTSTAGNRTRVTYLYEVWIFDDRQQWQVTSLRSKQELDDALDCLRQRAGAAVFGDYGSEAYKELVDAKEEMQRYVQERAYRQRKARLEEQERQEQERQAQNQVLTMPDGSVTSRITWDVIRQLLLRPGQTGQPSPFQLVPGIPFQGQGHTFSRLACIPGSAQELTRILLEEYSGRPGVPGQYAWIRDVAMGEAEEVLQGWLRGEIPHLENWTHMERAGRTWQQSSERCGDEISPIPPQPHPDWPWRLTVGGYAGSMPDPSWKDIEEELRELGQEADSFLILEQRDPQDPETCWFIQCAVVSQGTAQDKYAVEIGFSVPDGPRLWERMVPDVQNAIEYFSDVYHCRSVDASGFQKIVL